VADSAAVRREPDILAGREHRPSLAALVCVALALGLLAPAPARAELRQGGVITLGQAESVGQDLYVFARQTTIQGKVNGDLVVVGAQVTVEGVVTGDVIVTAGVVRISGEVQGSLRGTVGQLYIDGHVAHDVFVGAGLLVLETNGRVDRDLFAWAADAELLGPIQGTMQGGFGEAVVAGTVGGEVRVNAERLTVAAGARLQRGLVYKSERAATLSPHATVAGQIERQVPPAALGVGPLLFVYGWLRALAGLFGLGILLVLGFPDFTGRVQDTLRKTPGTSAGIGLATLVITPFAAALVMLLGVFVGGWWIGVMLLAVLCIAFALGLPVVGLFLGRWILTRARRTTHVSVALLLGLAVITLGWRLPWVGGLVFVLALLFGLGALVLESFRGRLPLAAPPAPKS